MRQLLAVALLVVFCSFTLAADEPVKLTQGNVTITIEKWPRPIDELDLDTGEHTITPIDPTHLYMTVRTTDASVTNYRVAVKLRSRSGRYTVSGIASARKAVVDGTLLQSAVTLMLPFRPDARIIDVSVKCNQEIPTEEQLFVAPQL